MKERIVELLQKVIKDNYDLELSDVKLWDVPKKMFGDYCFNAWILARDLRKNPKIIAEELKQFLEKDENDIFEGLEIAWAYLNVKVNRNNILEFLESSTINKLKENQKWKTIVVDYIWANVWKPLHIGHMCTPNQGQAMINAYKKVWYKVISDSHIGDWGIIFWKLITAYKYWGEEKKLKENAVEHLFNLYVKITSRIKNEHWKLDVFIDRIVEFFSENGYELPEKFTDWRWKEISLKHNFSDFEKLLNYTKDIDDKFFNFQLSQYKESIINLEEQTRVEFKKLSKWDEDSVKLWQSFTRESIKAMDKQLERLNIKCDYNIWESFYEWLGLPKIENYPDLEYSMKDIVIELIEKWIATKNDDGSVWVEFDEELKIPSCILQKRDWSHGYLASDLACIKYRMDNWSPDYIVYFVDVRQKLHLEQAFEISKKAWWLKREWKDNTELIHAYNWFIKLKDGAMSTRKWKIIKLDNLLDEAEERAQKIMLKKRDDIQWKELKELSKVIWIWAIKYGYLKKNRETDVVFDWDEFMTFEGNSWPYIQYAYVRARRILEKASSEWVNIQENFDGFENIAEDELDKIQNLVKILIKYFSSDWCLVEMIEKNMPHVLASYVFELTKIFNSFYNWVPILSEKNENKRNFKLSLVKRFSETVKECFEILGIDMPEKM